MYENDFNEPIGWNEGRSYGGGPLPSARSVSIILFKENNWQLDETFSGMLMQWGQFLGKGQSENNNNRNTVKFSKIITKNVKISK